MDVQKAALSQCISTDNGGAVSACQPLTASDSPDFAKDCPERAPIVNEPARGMIDKLPGCINITPGPGKAASADMTCLGNSTQPSTDSAAVSSSSSPVSTLYPVMELS